MDGTGVFYSYLCCDPDKESAVMDVVKGIFSEIEKTGISETELEAAKNKMLSAVTIKCEQPMGRLVSLGFNWIYNNQYRTVQQDMDAIKAGYRWAPIQCDFLSNLVNFVKYPLSILIFLYFYDI
jgi:predicted Zn-dependent peptidase